jgi:hypothetical protein
MSRAVAVIVGSAVAALLTAACHQPSPRPAPGCEPEVLAPPPEVAPPPAAAESATAVVVAAPPVDLPAAASAPAAPSPCNSLPRDPDGRPQSSQRVYAAALRYFLAHTAPGGAHDLGPDLAKERRSFRFRNTSKQETGEVMQSSIDELAAKYPGSVIVPATRPLRIDGCYDEVYLDLTEDGRYYVIIEATTARPVFMYWTSYRP